MWAMLRSLAAGALPRLAGPILAVLSVIAILLGARKAGQDSERARQAARNAEIRREQLDASTRRPRDRAALAKRMRDGGF